MLVSSALVLLMTPGLAFFYGGMVRSKSVLNMIMMSISAMGVVTVLWALYGYSIAFGDDVGNIAGNPSQYWGLKGLIGVNAVAADPSTQTAAVNIPLAGTLPATVFVAFQLMFAIITVALISGAVADRLKFELVIPVCTRLGLSPPDVRTLSKLVRHHLLLPITATRRDLNDPKTIEAVSEALGGDPQLLEVLHALSEADSKATGPGVWSDWKASLVDDLVRRCRMVMAGESLPQAEPTAPHYLSLAADHGVHVEISPRDGERIDAVIVAPDERGLVSKAAAVLALNSLRVHSASVNVHQGVAITEFVVSPLFGSPPAAELVRQQFVGALNGDVDVLGMLQKRDSDAASLVSARAGDVQAGVPVTRTAAPPRILWLDTAAPAKLILEVRAMDRAGLLALLAGALEGAGAGIVWAKVNTFGSTAADVFCVTVPAELDARAAVEQHLLEVLGASVDVVVDEPVGD
ncbi:hypothetical protein ACNJEG_19245 [Mycobacterium tuberculosis]